MFHFASTVLSLMSEFTKENHRERLEFERNVSTSKFSLYKRLAIHLDGKMSRLILRG